MRQVSETYNPFPVVRSPDVFMTFEVLETSITKQQISIASDTGAKVGVIRNALNAVPEIARKYATLEQYGWPLDGSCTVMPDSGVEVGFWPNRLTDANGTFTTPITVTCVLPKPIHTLGWTFHFDEPTRIYCPEVRAQCYDANDNLIDDYTDTLIDDTEAGNGWRLSHSVTQYKKVVFTFSRLNEPYRFMRLVEIDFGISRSFNKNTIGDVTITHELSLDGSSLPAKKIVFTFDNHDKEFNVLNPIDVYQYWRNGQSVSAFIKIGDDLVNMGTYFISRAEIGRSYLTAKVTAYDEVNQLGSQTFYPGTLAQRTSVTLREAVEKCLDGYGMGVNYNGLENQPVSVAVNDNHEKRAILHYLAQAVRASVWIDRDDVVQFKRMEVKSTPDAELTADALYDWSGVSIAEEIKGVTLSVDHELDEEAMADTYTAGSPDAEGETAAYYSNPCVAPGQGQAVADWLLVMANMAKKYAVKNRCDPAVEIGDTLKIADVFGNDDNAVITGLTVNYNGVLSAVTEAAGEFDA